MNWMPLESSVLASAAYSPGERQLYLEFRNGAVYRYFDVSPQQYGEFLAADSKGRYFDLSIRDRFECQQVNPPNRIAS